MVKRIGRRFVSLLLTFVTILTMLPAMTLPALAAAKGDLSIADKNIGLTYDGTEDGPKNGEPWYVDGADIIGSTITTGTACANYTQHESTLTITNKKNTTATLSFDYTVTVGGGKIIVGKESVTANGSFSKDLDSNGTATVFIQSNKESKETATTITISNIKLIAHVNATVTFQPAKNGSYTVNGNQITEPYENTQSSTTPYKVNATPAGGYQFMGWYDVTNGKYISTAAATELNIESDCTITARFASKTAALFETGGWLFDDLDEAAAYAQANSQDKITLASDGKITGNYTIPTGVTLLIPFDAGKTLYTKEPACVAGYESQSVFRKLTMAPGSSITVKGAISVGGKYSQQQGNQGPTGPYGQIDMAADSSIVLKNGANLYAWGYITGDGQITAEFGATVYECFQVRDWRGGTAVTYMINAVTGKTVFPFSQYYVQNIEAPLTLQYGAAEKAFFSALASGSVVSTTIDFIGAIGAKGLFKLNSGGSITKRYVPASGRTEYTTRGTAFLDYLEVKVLVHTINSQNYVLPINGNMTLNIASGKVTANYDLCLLPGVQINIAKDAELEIAQDAGLYVYDSEQWGNYCQCDNKKIADVNYSPSPDRRVRTVYDLVDAKIDLNGKLTAIGSVYTTQSGANICSSEGGGKYVQQSAPGTNKTTLQATQNNKSISYTDIPITPAQLQNAASAPTLTAGSKAGDTFTYCKCQDCGGGKWTNGLQVAAIIKSDGTHMDYPTLQKAVEAYTPDDSTHPKNYIKMLHNTTENITTPSNIFLDLNGRTVTGSFNFKINGNSLYGMDSTTDDYVGTNAGKIVGSVAPYAKTFYQTGNAGDTYNRYVAIPGKENGKPTVSFHRFNISVTGYRFELATGDKPQCALFFIGKFQGDKAAKDYLTSLGITLTGDNGPQLGTYSYSIPKDEVIPEESKPGDSPVVHDAAGAYLFEAFLKRSFEKDPLTTASVEFSAIAKATFGTNGETQNSETKEWSFREAWQNALTDPDMDISQAEKDILTRFLTELGIPIPK